MRRLLLELLPRPVAIQTTVELPNGAYRVHLTRNGLRWLGVTFEARR